MSLSVCPIATVQAPAERVWKYLSEPANYALWWDAETRRIAPQGPAQAGQKIFAQTKALGKWWNVTVLVEEVNAADRRIHLKTMLPFGITVYNRISCSTIDRTSSRVSFG